VRKALWSQIVFDTISCMFFPNILLFIPPFYWCHLSWELLLFFLTVWYLAMSQNAKQEIYHLESRGTIYSYFDFSLKPAVVSCLTNALAPPPIALESCSMAQTDQTVFPDCTRKTFLVGGCGFFVGDVISEVVFGPFCLMLTGLGPNRQASVFHWSFRWELGSSLSLLSLWSTF